MSKGILLIHGYLTTTEDFGRLYDYLDCYDEVCAVKIPGHNGKVNFRAFTVESTQTAVMTAFDELASRHDEVDVVGFSMGGGLTTWLCALRKVHRAVLISPANKFLNPALLVDAAKFYGSLTKNAINSAESFEDRRKAVKKAWKPYEENMSVAGKIAWQRTFRYMTPRNLWVFDELMKQADTLVRSAKPQTPILILWGKLDELVPEKSSEFISENFANAQVKIYPDVGHAMLYTNRDHIIIKDVMDFLTEGTFSAEIPPRE